MSEISDAWKLGEIVDHVDVNTDPDIQEKLHDFSKAAIDLSELIKKAVRSVSRNINSGTSYPERLQLFNTDPVGWTIPVYIELSGYRPRSEGLHPDALACYEWWDEPYSNIGEDDGYPHRICSRIVLYIDKILDHAACIYDNRGQWYDMISDPYSPLFCAERYTWRKDIEEYFTDLRSRAKDVFLKRVLEYVIAHELFHAYQDYHVGFVAQKKAGSFKEQNFKDILETQAEFFAMDYVMNVVNEKCLAWGEYAKWREVLHRSTNNGLLPYAKAIEAYGKIDFRPTLYRFAGEFAEWLNHPVLIQKR